MTLMKLNSPLQRLRAGAGLIAFGSLASLQAAPTQVLTETRYPEFAKGELRQVALDHEGVLRPAPALSAGIDLGAAVAWTAVADGAGGQYIALGPEGRVVRLGADGELAPVHRFSEGLVRALAVDAEGFLFVGTSVPGRVYRINADGRAELWHDAAETYVWDLLPDAEGGLLVATGLPGKVYRLPPGHRPGTTPEAWWTTPGGHATSLVRAADGTVLAGTSGDGLLVRLEGAGSAKVLWATEGAEVRAIWPAADGTVVFATFPPAAASASGGTGSSPAASAAAAAAAAAAASTAGATTASATPGGSVTVGEPVSAPAGGLLLRWTTDGFVRPFWTPPKGGIFSILPATGGGYLVGTNDSGRLYRVQEDATWTLLQQAPQGSEVSRLRPDPDGGAGVLTSHPARWYRLGEAPSAEARFTSSALDARQPARWASLQVEAEDGSPAVVGVQVRTGHTTRPGETWSEWRDAEAAEAGRWVVAGEPARYLQYALNLTEPTATVRRVRAFARTANQMPLIAGVRVLPYAFEQQRSPAQAPSVDIRRLLEERQIENLVRDPNSARLQFRNTPADGVITVAWRALDPDGDELRFRVSLRPEPAGEWLVVADDLTEPVATLTTRGLQEGLYRIRVEASDRVDNEPAEALVANRDSEPFMIDLTPPELVVAAMGARRWRVTASDTHSLLRRAWMQVDGGPEVRLRPEDGVFDQRQEAFIVEGERWPAEARSVMVFVEDEAGRIGLAAWALP